MSFWSDISSGDIIAIIAELGMIAVILLPYTSEDLKRVALVALIGLLTGRATAVRFNQKVPPVQG